MILQTIRPGELEVTELTVISDVAVLGLLVARYVAPRQHLATLFTCVAAPFVRHLTIYIKYCVRTQHFSSTIGACILILNFYIFNTPYLFQVFLWDIRRLGSSHLGHVFKFRWSFSFRLYY